MGKDVGSSDQQDVQPENLGQSSQDTMGRGNGVASFPEMTGESWHNSHA